MPFSVMSGGGFCICPATSADQGCCREHGPSQGMEDRSPTSHWPVGDLAASNIFFRPSIPDMASTFLRQSPTSTGRSCREGRGWGFQWPCDGVASSPTLSHPVAQSPRPQRTSSMGKAAALLRRPSPSEPALLCVPARRADWEDSKQQSDLYREVWIHVDTPPKPG